MNCPVSPPHHTAGNKPKSTATLHSRGEMKHREGDEKTNGAKTVEFFVPLAVDAGVHCTNESRHADTIDFFDVPTTSILLWHEPCTFVFVPLAAA